LRTFVVFDFGNREKITLKAPIAVLFTFSAKAKSKSLAA
jgi:hypothetical protein